MTAPMWPSAASRQPRGCGCQTASPRDTSHTVTELSNSTAAMMLQSPENAATLTREPGSAGSVTAGSSESTSQTQTCLFAEHVAARRPSGDACATTGGCAALVRSTRPNVDRSRWFASQRATLASCPNEMTASDGASASSACRRGRVVSRALQSAPVQATNRQQNCQLKGIARFQLQHTQEP